MSDLNNTERDAILRRVQKLLAIAQDHRANPHEAAAAASQAEKIMRKFQFDHADVLASRIKADGDELNYVDVVATAKTNGTRVEKIAPWISWMAYRLAELHDCGYRYGWTQTAKGCEACVRFYGYKADTQVAAWTLEYLVATVNRLCTAYRDSVEYKLGGRAVMDSYRKGISSGICSLLTEAKKAKDVEAAQAVQSRALMVVKQQAITDKFGAFNYRSRTATTSSAGAFANGVAVGRKVDVHRRGIGGGSDNTGRLK